MTEIEGRLEVPDHAEPDYARVTMSEGDIESGRHRHFVGGMWDTMGKHQMEFLIEQGLTPQSRCLDVGCGSLRAGRHLVDYLDPGNYYGIDVNHSLLEVGYNEELDDSLRGRLPIENLHSTDRFDADFGVKFDIAIAQSVFTHVSLNHMRLCMFRVAKVMRPGGKFYVTFFERRRKFPVDGVPVKHPKFTERNIYWYYRSDMRWVSKGSPWSHRYIGQWGHPRNQRMMEYTRLDD